MTAHWLVAKYVADIRRREPINVGVLLYVDSVVYMRFLGENERGVLNGRRLRGKVEAVANYKAWVAHWRDAAQSMDRAALVGKPSRGDNYFLEVGGETIKTERSPGELLRFLFDELVAVPTSARLTKADAVFDRLDLEVETDVFIPMPSSTAHFDGPDHVDGPGLVDELYFDYRFQNGATNLMRTVRVGTAKAWDKVNAAKYSFEKARDIKAGNLIALVQRGLQLIGKDALSQMRSLERDAQIVELDNEESAATKLAELLHLPGR
jgi:hypothetical protein